MLSMLLDAQTLSKVTITSDNGAEVLYFSFPFFSFDSIQFNSIQFNLLIYLSLLIY